MPVADVVGALAHPPRYPPLRPVRPMPRDRSLVGLRQQRGGERPHDQQRHQVLEHAAAPRHQGALACRGRQRSAQLEPVLQRSLVLGDGDEAREPRLGGEQVVEGVVERVGGLLEADGEQLPLAIDQEAEVHLHGIGVRPVADGAEPGRQLGPVARRGLVGRQAAQAPFDPVQRRMIRPKRRPSPARAPAARRSWSRRARSARLGPRCVRRRRPDPGGAPRPIRARSPALGPGGRSAPVPRRAPGSLAARRSGGPRGCRCPPCSTYAGSSTLQVPQVVPVVEMAAEAPHPLQRAERPLEPLSPDRRGR